MDLHTAVRVSLNPKYSQYSSKKCISIYVNTNASVLLVGHCWLLRDTELGQDEMICVIWRLMACIVQLRLAGLRRLRWLEHVSCTRGTEINTALWSGKQKDA